MSEPLCPQTQKFLRLPAVLELFPVGKSTWWAGVRKGRFPKGVKLGPNTTAWRIEDIQQLIATFSSEELTSPPKVKVRA